MGAIVFSTIDVCDRDMFYNMGVQRGRTTTVAMSSTEAQIMAAFLVAAVFFLLLDRGLLDQLGCL